MSIERPADDEFWTRIAIEAERGVFMREQWAWGSVGFRWYYLTPSSLPRVRSKVEPRSLVEVRAKAGLIDLEDASVARVLPAAMGGHFTALGRGAESDLVPHRQFFDETLTREYFLRRGFHWIVPSGQPAEFRAVAPDSDGVVRARWRESS